MGAAVTGEVPFGVGGHAVLESPGRIRASTGVGVLQRPYVDALAGALASTLGLGPSVADLVVDAAADSLWWRLGLGLRPWPARGWFIQAGYGVLALGGSVTSGAAIDAALAEAGLSTFDDTVQGALGAQGYANRRWTTSLVMHRAWFEVGHVWSFAEEHVTLALVFGFSATVGARAGFTPTLGRVYRADEVQRALDDAATLMEGAVRQYFHVPTLSLRLGAQVLGPARDWDR